MGGGEDTDGKQTQFPNTDLFASEVLLREAPVRVQEVGEGLTWSGDREGLQGE